MRRYTVLSRLLSLSDFYSMQDIKAWLSSNGDFALGVQLLAKNGGSKFYVDLLKAQGPSEFNIRKLRTELEKLCPTSDQPEPVQALTKIVKTEPIKTKPVQYPIKDDQQIRYLRLIEKQNQTYRQLDHNNNALDFSTDQDVLYQTAIQLKRLWANLQEIYAELAYYQEHKRFPDPVPEKEITTDEMQRLYVSIWKAEKRLEKTDCRNRYKTEALLKQKRERLQQLKDNG